MDSHTSMFIGAGAVGGEATTEGSLAVRERSTDDNTTRCHRCGDVIGAYEPMVVLRDGRAYSTSRASVPDARVHGQECYHDVCYGQLRGDERGT